MVNRYLLATHRAAGVVPGAPQSTEEMQAFMERVMALEEDLESAGVFVFGGALTSPEQASIVHVGDELITDGPFAESKEQIAGFYIIDAEDDDVAQTWARRVADATNHSIEMRRLASTGRVMDKVG